MPLRQNFPPIVNGDTLVIGATRLRLDGID
jgi:hypothetical protein